MKKAIIIGATSGIGQEVAKCLLLDGWQFGRGTRDTTSLDSEVSFGRAAEDFALNPFFFCRQTSFSPF